MVHTKAAVIDLGSKEHYVGVSDVTLPPSATPEPVRKSGCLTPDLIEMADMHQAVQAYDFVPV